MAPGPIPNRSENLSRARNADRADRPDLKKGELRPVRIPHPDPDWHPIATMVYKGLRSSGMADFYQNSDWAIAWSLCEDLSVYKKSGKRSGQMLQVIYSTFSTLGISEGDRRRMRIELDEPEVESTASVTAIDEYKAALQVA